MPSNAEKFDERAGMIAESHKANARISTATAEEQALKMVTLSRLRGRIEGLLIAKAVVTGGDVNHETIDAKADELLGVARVAQRNGLIR